MAYEIETGVEMPARRARAAKYPWDSLAVGQSFFVEGRKKRIIVPKRFKPTGVKFSQAVMNKNGVGSPMGLRVRRVG